MANFGAFFGTFLGYVITLVIIIVVAAIGFIVGFFLRKNLDKKKAAENKDNPVSAADGGSTAK